MNEFFVVNDQAYESFGFYDSDGEYIQMISAKLLCRLMGRKKFDKLCGEAANNNGKATFTMKVKISSHDQS